MAANAVAAQARRVATAAAVASAARVVFPLRGEIGKG
jgi:hypothetical protein